MFKLFLRRSVVRIVHICPCIILYFRYFFIPSRRNTICNVNKRYKYTCLNVVRSILIRSVALVTRLMKLERRYLTQINLQKCCGFALIFNNLAYFHNLKQCLGVMHVFVILQQKKNSSKLASNFAKSLAIIVVKPTLRFGFLVSIQSRKL